MRLRQFVAVATLCTALVGFGTPASADVTAFLGLASGPSNRMAKGAAVGGGLVIVGFEFEVSETGEDAPNGAPRIRTGMVNGILQTPGTMLAGFQLYATAGGGVYNHQLGSDSQIGIGVNSGGGLKRNLAGPLRLRVDYRVFKFSGSPIASRIVHRFYVGVNIKF